MKVLDLFSGIGGFSLGLERAGMETVAFCEIEGYPRKVLKKHWPDVPIAGDIRKLTYKRTTQELVYDGGVIYVGTINAICGGFPCQPFSVAGKQRGKEDDRHLWPEMLRLICEIQPTWVIGENVAGFITMALDDVLSDLEREGYTCQAFVIPACAVNAIHRRDRVWIVAYTNKQGESGKPVDDSAGKRFPANANGTADGKQYQHEKSGNNGERKVYGICSDTNNGESSRHRQSCREVLRKQESDGCNEIHIRKNVEGGG